MELGKWNWALLMKLKRKVPDKPDSLGTCYYNDDEGAWFAWVAEKE